MKKNIVFLILLFLMHFFAINYAYCEEDFFMDADFVQAKNQQENTNQVNDVKKNTIFDKVSSFFNSSKDEEEKGYYGKLPNVEADFQYKKQSEKTHTESDMIIKDDEEIDEDEFKQAPIDDALFLDKIIKKEDSSQYVKDIQKTKNALISLKYVIENKANIQKFNACVNMLDMYSKNLKIKYENKSEALKDSYIDILDTSYQAKVLGNLKYDANYYARYIPTQNGKYSKNNILNEEMKLLEKIDKTLFSINNEL